jgi:hypothetical protein
VANFATRFAIAAMLLLVGITPQTSAAPLRGGGTYTDVISWEATGGSFTCETSPDGYCMLIMSRQDNPNYYRVMAYFPEEGQSASYALNYAMGGLGSVNHISIAGTMPTTTAKKQSLLNYVTNLQRNSCHECVYDVTIIVGDPANHVTEGLSP